MLEGSGVPFQIGDILAGKFRIERVLGKGAMGVVIAAMHLDLGELRAIKFMLPTALAGVEAVERFMREARAVVRLKSQHITKVHDVGRLDSGAPFIVMEYLEGADLGTLLRGRKALSVEDAVAYLLQASEAVGEAHAAGIVHRDLKLSNLFLTSGVKGVPCIKVLDFGIAKLMSPRGEAPIEEMTETGMVLGTPSYMSPEQVRSTRDVDERTDVWALGVILFRVLTGHLPFGGDSSTQICVNVVMDHPRAPSTICPELPQELDEIVLSCLEKDRTRRYASVTEFVTALSSLKRSRAGSTPAVIIPHRASASKREEDLRPEGLETRREGPEMQREEAEKQSEEAETRQMISTAHEHASVYEPRTSSLRRTIDRVRRPIWPAVIIATVLCLLALGAATRPLLSPRSKPQPQVYGAEQSPVETGPMHAPSLNVVIASADPVIPPTNRASATSTPLPALAPVSASAIVRRRMNKKETEWEPTSSASVTAEEEPQSTQTGQSPAPSVTASVPTPNPTSNLFDQAGL